MSGVRGRKSPRTPLPTCEEAFMKAMIGIVLVTAIAIVSLPEIAAARTWTVGKDGSSDFETMTAACSTAASGDTLLVAPGDYDEFPTPITITRKTLTILGQGATPDDTALRLSIGLYNCDDTMFENVLFHDSVVGLILSEGSATIKRCAFRDNGRFLYGGHGIQCSGTEALVEDCIFSGNACSGSDGGGSRAVCSLYAGVSS